MLVETLNSISELISNVRNVANMFTSKKDQKEREKQICDKVNAELNKKLDCSVNTSFCDPVRKEKQEEIERLKDEK